jgi:hypothetical protein
MSRTLACLLAAMVCAVRVSAHAAVAGDQEPASAKLAVGVHDWSVSGPCSHENLAVYLIHGSDLLSGRSFITLQEALAQNKAQVRETGNVNELAIENLSENEELFVQAGEIVRGGKQDRVLAVDLIIGPGSGKVPIGSFCVESGRWQRRGAEGAWSFASAENMVFSNELKLAVVGARSQGAVWQHVEEAQDRLASTLGTTVADAESPTSLELSLEQGKVQNTAAEYVDKLLGGIQAKDDIVGFVIAINGEVHCADVYASRQLFSKLCSKLLESAAIEAIALLRTGQVPGPPALDEVHGVLVAAEDAKASKTRVSPRVEIVVRESTKWLITETLDGDAWIHRAYVKK